MAYYTALITAWNNANSGSVPNGVTGSSFNGLTTQAQKLAAINAWTVTGSIPTTAYISGVQLANCINWIEFNALTAQQQSNLLTLCNQTGLMLGGSANTSHLLVGMILAYFNVNGTTVANLTALAIATVEPWWQANGYSSAFNANDLTAAGGLS